MRIEQTLSLTAPKKHSVRYDSDELDAAVRALYVSKTALLAEDVGSWPKTLILTIESEDE